MEYGSEILAYRSKRRIRQEPLAKKARIYTGTLVDIEQRRIGIDQQTYQTLISCIDDLANEIPLSNETENAA